MALPLTFDSDVSSVTFLSPGINLSFKIYRTTKFPSTAVEVKYEAADGSWVRAKTVFPRLENALVWVGSVDPDVDFPSPTIESVLPLKKTGNSGRCTFYTRSDGTAVELWDHANIESRSGGAIELFMTCGTDHVTKEFDMRNDALKFARRMRFPRV